MADTPDHPTHDDVGNFTLRLGYVTGALREPKLRAYLIARGATEAQIEGAFNALVELADAAFYRRMGKD